MNLEQRLQHAARELRELPIDVPPLGNSVRRTPRPVRMLQALAAPMLFVAGGLFAIGSLDDRPGPAVFSDVSGSPPTVGAPTNSFTPPRAQANNVVPAPSVRAELQMIAEIVSSNQRAGSGSTAPPRTAATDAPSELGSRAESIGPI